MSSNKLETPVVRRPWIPRRPRRRRRSYLWPFVSRALRRRPSSSHRRRPAAPRHHPRISIRSGSYRCSSRCKPRLPSTPAPSSRPPTPSMGNSRWTSPTNKAARARYNRSALSCVKKSKPAESFYWTDSCKSSTEIIMGPHNSNYPPHRQNGGGGSAPNFSLVNKNFRQEYFLHFPYNSK